ncbi:hypothetical protein FOT62_22745 [Serratia marcescens]|uniref:Uncharacterized protein n=1 Tax=Serratia marcescens TaxID=615 RepID=A0A5C7BRW5_SERMA|nr:MULTISPECIES: hypothetical protein [Serratia]TXE27141.1 hypothetical protein FOT62_22745 [Serratia marcescens]TXE55302.1 hypothetical protein FOT56_25420 [Serratia marcescens]
MTKENALTLDQKLKIAQVAVEIVKAGSANRNGITGSVGGSGPDAPYLAAFRAAYDFVSE